MEKEEQELDGVALIAAERYRQKNIKDWTPEHDDEHDEDQLAIAASIYALPSRLREVGPLYYIISRLWPWGEQWWKPSPGNRIKEMAKVGALAAAEIDRLKRLEGISKPDRPIPEPHECECVHWARIIKPGEKKLYWDAHHPNCEYYEEIENND